MSSATNMEADSTTDVTLTGVAQRLEEAQSNVRKSRRLSGQRPDYSLMQAQVAMDSPRANRSRSRRSSVGSEDGDKVTTVVKMELKMPEVIIEEEQEEKENDETVAKQDKDVAGKDKVDSKVPKAAGASANKVPSRQNIPKGRCKSGRFWKSERDRFRSVIKSKGLKQSYLDRQRQKDARNRARQMEADMREDKKRQLEELKKRREENKKRREENERKAEIVQVVSYQYS